MKCEIFKYKGTEIRCNPLTDNWFLYVNETPYPFIGSLNECIKAADSVISKGKYTLRTEFNN